MIARVELGLSDEEWLDMSYRQFDLLHDRHLTLRWRAEWQMGSAIAAIYRCGMRNFDPMPKPDDFVFTPRPGERKKSHSRRSAKKRMTRQKHENIAALFRSIAIPVQPKEPDAR